MADSNHHFDKLEPKGNVVHKLQIPYNIFYFISCFHSTILSFYVLTSFIITL